MQIPIISAPAVPELAFLLDVREDDEYAAGHAPNAVHLPMMQLPNRLDEIPREGDVVVVCRSGRRSAQVVAYLRANGFDNVVNLDGGMQDWAAFGRAVVAKDGQPGQVI